MTRALVWAVTVAMVVPLVAPAQQVTLEALHDRALVTDARGAQRASLADATRERLAAIGTERRPQLALRAQASWQSDVTAVQLGLPGANPPVPPKERWQATVSGEQLVFDGGGLRARQDVERARLIESLAGVDAMQHARRGEVNGAFFGAWLAGERVATLDALIADLEARVTQARVRVEAGTALPADTARLRATQVEAEEQREAAVAQRRAALEVLALLTGDAIAPESLALPDLEAAVRAARAVPAQHRRDRPEFAQLAATRSRLSREIAQQGIQNRPRVVGFAEGGIGRPGLNQFRTDTDAFATLGLRLEWRPWTWGSAGMAARALAAQQAVVGTEESALAEAVARLVESDLAELDRLAGSLARDERLVALRAEVERTARTQFDEGSITAADYVEARTALLTASLDRDRHRAERAQAQARYLTTLGLPLR